MKKKTTYRISFHSQGKVYEIYAKEVIQGALLGFVEVEGILFGEKTSLVVDPSEEHLKAEFAGVSRTFIPMHAVIRIDVVEKTGPGKITDAGGRGDKVTPFPTPLAPERAGSALRARPSGPAILRVVDTAGGPTCAFRTGPLCA